jgi:hypothetical protein
MKVYSVVSLALHTYLSIYLTIAVLDHLPEANLCIEYCAPCDLSKNVGLSALVSDKTKKIVPVVIEDGVKKVDFKFLRGDLGQEQPEIAIVTLLRDYLNGTHPPTIFTINLRSNIIKLIRAVSMCWLVLLVL